MNLKKLPHIGDKRLEILKGDGCNCIDDIKKYDPEKLQDLLGVSRRQSENILKIASKKNGKKSIISWLGWALSGITAVLVVFELVVNFWNIKQLFFHETLSLVIYPDKTIINSKISEYLSGNDKLVNQSRQQYHLGVLYRHDIFNKNTNNLCTSLPFYAVLSGNNVPESTDIVFEISGLSDHLSKAAEKSGYPTFRQNMEACRYMKVAETRTVGRTIFERDIVDFGDKRIVTLMVDNLQPDLSIESYIPIPVSPNVNVYRESDNKQPYSTDPGQADLSNYSENENIIIETKPMTLDVYSIINRKKQKIGGVDLYIHLINIDADLYNRSLIFQKHGLNGTLPSIYNLFTNSTERNVFIIPERIYTEASYHKGVKEYYTNEKTSFKSSYLKQYNFINEYNKEVLLLGGNMWQDSFYVEPTTIGIAHSINKIWTNQNLIKIPLLEFNKLRNSVRSNIVMQRQFTNSYWKWQFDKFGVKNAKPSMGTVGDSAKRFHEEIEKITNH